LVRTGDAMEGSPIRMEKRWVPAAEGREARACRGGGERKRVVLKREACCSPTHLNTGTRGETIRVLSVRNVLRFCQQLRPAKENNV